ncbi:MAG: (2Fe-2S)-binding protein [Bacteroidales bacterium]
MESNIIICYCMKVDRNTIIDAIRQGAVTVADVEATTGAAGGCGRCQGRIQELIEAEVKAKSEQN